MQAIDALYDVIVKIAYDTRFEPTEKRERVSATFFALIRLVRPPFLFHHHYHHHQNTSTDRWCECEKRKRKIGD